MVKSSRASGPGVETTPPLPPLVKAFADALTDTPGVTLPLVMPTKPVMPTTGQAHRRHMEKHRLARLLAGPCVFKGPGWGRGKSR